MKDALLELLNRRLPMPGVAAWSARLPDRSLIHQAYSDWFSEEQLEQIISRLALAADGLGYHGIQPVRLCWIFEHARIHLALRHDGPCLAFFVENRAGYASAKVESLLEEFSSLPLSPPPPSAFQTPTET